MTGFIPVPPDPWVPTATDSETKLFPAATMDALDEHNDGRYATTEQGAKADSAYQLPEDGVPATDLAEAVQTSLGKADEAVPNTEAGRAALAASPELGAAYDDRAADFIASHAPSFAKPLSAPVVVAPASGSDDDAYAPWVINAEAVLGESALDKFYMYTSSDHSAGAGGIFLRTAPSLAGPWTSPALVYVDTVAGSQTETAAVVWNPETELFHMYYQQYTMGVTGFTAGQSTGLATSPDGVNWTRVGIVLTTPNQIEVMGAGQLTYFRPFRIGGQWVGYHLYAPGDQFRSGMSFSQDGLVWVTDRQQLGLGPQWEALDGRAIAWHLGNAVRWRGQSWFVGLATEFVSGVDAGEHLVIIAPLSADMRRFIGSPTVILTVTQAWESANYRGVYAFVDGDHIHVFYQSDKDGEQPSIGYATTQGAVA
tara:strand:+ start:1768 stop:3042 length:1275 start_codon:yes stop_codon:yes gene_type:complete